MPPPPRRPRARPLADLVEPVLGPALAAQGFASSAVVLHWPDVVGPRLAARCEPLGLRWPPRPAGEDGAARAPRRGGALVVRVAGPYAPEVQHLAPVIAERVNALVGWRLVERVVLRQGGAPPAPAAPPRPPAPSPAARARAGALVAGVEGEGLRAALQRLGAGVIARAGG